MTHSPLIHKLVAVLPRYGKSLGGGAETLVYELLQALKNHPELVSEIEVWTTCAIDHRTWANDLPAGQSIEEGIKVTRFAVSERNLELFIKHELEMQSGKILAVDDQLEWLTNSVNSQDLYAHICNAGKDVDLILFAPYLFPTSFWGPFIYPEKSILIPCLHDEHYAYQTVFRALFKAVRGLIFNAQGEMELAQSLFALEHFTDKSAVVGMGFTPRHFPSAKTPSLLRDKPYLLYSGRKEQGKNLPLLIEYFETYRTTTGDSDLELILIGSGEVHFRPSLPGGVIDLGFVSEQEKLDLMAGALALCQPSLNESFSIVMMEAWLTGVPVLVHAHSVVPREHVVNSNGGLYFANSREFVAVVSKLKSDPLLQESLGQNGKKYVEQVYAWEAVIERFSQALEKFGFSQKSDDRSEQAQTQY
ncbi:glycosyltransferase family 4 protein [bacterium]|nr:glycosyltransferase family 4 protein [bacterium]